MRNLNCSIIGRWLMIWSRRPADTRRPSDLLTAEGFIAERLEQPEFPLCSRALTEVWMLVGRLTGEIRNYRPSVPQLGERLAGVHPDFPTFAGRLDMVGADGSFRFRHRCAVLD